MDCVHLYPFGDRLYGDILNGVTEDIGETLTKIH